MNTGLLSSLKQDVQMGDKSNNFTEIMMQRWMRSNANLPDLDKKDITEDSPLFNLSKK